MDHFDTKEADTLEKITQVYRYEKDLMLHAEELNEESFLPPINEIKDAFDHLMRVFAVKCNLKTTDEQDYTYKNLDATFRHLYRATFDLLDYIRIFQRERVEDMLEGISREAISVVFPEYYRDIRPEIERALDKIPIYKGEKDIGNPNLDNIKGYCELVKSIKADCIKIEEKLPGLIQYEEQKKKEEAEKSNKIKNDKYKEYAVLFLIATLSAIGGGLAVYYYTRP
jgi:hypothetical protein